MLRKYLSCLLLILVCVSCQSNKPTPVTEVNQYSSPTNQTATNPLKEPTATKSLVIETLTATPLLKNSDRIVFYSNRTGNPEIYSINLTTNETTQLTDDPAFDDSPAVSPDGKQVVFLTARHDPDPKFPNLKYEIYIMDIDGGNQQRLTNTESSEDHPDWSPDGSKIIFDTD